MKVVYNACFGGFGLSPKAINECAKRGHQIEVDYDLDRSHPVLVSVVEDLGSEANGRSASLRIRSWEDGVPFRIEEYDGAESVKVDYPALIQKLHEEHGDLIPAQLLLNATKMKP
jgi:hypothetical protein